MCSGYRKIYKKHTWKNDKFHPFFIFFAFYINYISNFSKDL